MISNLLKPPSASRGELFPQKLSVIYDTVPRDGVNGNEMQNRGAAVPSPSLNAYCHNRILQKIALTYELIIVGRLRLAPIIF